jgi:hypothetical protein
MPNSTNGLIFTLSRLSVAVLMVAISPEVYAQPTVPWSPTKLPTISQADASLVLEHADVRRAELGYLYSLPAFLHMRQRFTWVSAFTQYMPEKGNPFGQFFLLRKPTSSETLDPSPNHDTLYGATFMDLAASPMVLSVPDVPDRYYSVAMVDAYFYNFAYVGSRTTGQRAGNYLIVGPNWHGKKPKGIDAVIVAPTHSINMYQRIYFKNSADVPNVIKLQDQITLKPLARFLDPKAKVDLGDPKRVLAVNPFTATDPVQMFRMVNPYMKENPPPESSKELVEHCVPVGIGPGVAVPENAAAQGVLQRGAALAAETLSAMDVAGLKVVNGWQIPPANVAKRGGAGGTAMQALVQIRTIGLNIPEEALYYTTYSDSNGQPLSSAKRYVMHFAKDDLPPINVQKFGFWSLTMMHRSNFLLVDNPENKYNVRSADALRYGKDGSLTLYLQTVPPVDPALRANWLPAPASGEFTLNLRVYLPTAQVLAGEYAPPPLVEVN